MKVILTLLLFFSSARSFAQSPTALPLDAETHLITYAGEVQVPGASQAELYARATFWFANVFASPKVMAQVADKEAGVRQGKGWTPISVHFMGANLPANALRLWYSVKLTLKGGRYLYQISNFGYEPASTNSSHKPSPTPLEPILTPLADAPVMKYGGMIEEYRQAVNKVAVDAEASLRVGMALPAGTRVDKSTE